MAFVVQCIVKAFGFVGLSKAYNYLHPYTDLFYLIITSYIMLRKCIVLDGITC